MTTSSLIRLSGIALVLAAALFSVAEVTSFYIFADHGEAYDLRKFALTDSFLLQSLLTLFAGALLLGGWSVSTSGKPKQPGDWG
jgi:hypothetical protein